MKQFINPKNTDILSLSFKIKGFELAENYEKCKEIQDYIEEYMLRYSDVKNVFFKQYKESINIEEELLFDNRFASGREVANYDKILIAMLGEEIEIDHMDGFARTCTEFKKISLHPDEFGVVYNLKSIDEQEFPVLELIV